MAAKEREAAESEAKKDVRELNNQVEYKQTVIEKRNEVEKEKDELIKDSDGIEKKKEHIDDEVGEKQRADESTRKCAGPEKDNDESKKDEDESKKEKDELKKENELMKTRLEEKCDELVNKDMKSAEVKKERDQLKLENDQQNELLRALSAANIDVVWREEGSTPVGEVYEDAVEEQPSGNNDEQWKKCTRMRFMSRPITATTHSPSTNHRSNWTSRRETLTFFGGAVADRPKRYWTKARVDNFVKEHVKCPPRQIGYGTNKTYWELLGIRPIEGVNEKGELGLCCPEKGCEDRGTGIPYWNPTDSNVVDHHRRKHTVVIPYVCKVCSAEHDYLENALDHLWKKHFSVEKFPCVHCQKKFYFDYEYDAHECEGHEPVGGGKRGGRGGRGSGRGRGRGNGGSNTDVGLPQSNPIPEMTNLNLNSDDHDLGPARFQPNVYNVAHISQQMAAKEREVAESEAKKDVRELNNQFEYKQTVIEERNQAEKEEDKLKKENDGIEEKEDIDDEVGEKQRADESTRKENDESNKENDESNKENDESKKENDESKEDEDESKKEKDELKKEKDELKKENDELKKKNDELKKKNDELKKDNNELKKEKDEVKKENELMKTLLKEKNDKLVKISTYYTELEEEKRKNEVRHQQEMGDETLKVHALTMEIERLKREIAELERALYEANAEIPVEEVTDQDVEDESHSYNSQESVDGVEGEGEPISGGGQDETGDLASGDFALDNARESYDGRLPSWGGAGEEEDESNEVQRAAADFEQQQQLASGVGESQNVQYSVDYDLGLDDNELQYDHQQPSHEHLNSDTHPPYGMGTNRKKRAANDDSSLAKRPKQGGGRKGHNEGASGSKKMLLDEQEEDMEAGGDQFECEDGLMDILQRVIDNRAQFQKEVSHLHTLDIEYEDKRETITADGKKTITVERKTITVEREMHSDCLVYKSNLNEAERLRIDMSSIDRMNGRREIDDWIGKEARIDSVNGNPAPSRNTAKDVVANFFPNCKKSKYPSLLAACPSDGYSGHSTCLTKEVNANLEEIEVLNKKGKLVLKKKCPAIVLKTGERCPFLQTPSNLIDHLRSRHTLRYSHYCKACPEGRMTLEDMKIHLCRDHFKMDTFKCDHCGEEFYFDYEYEAHKLKKHAPGGAISGGTDGRETAV